jgi:hypothetical protein
VIVSHNIANTPYAASGIQQIETPAPQESQAEGNAVNAEGPDLSSAEGRDSFWQKTMDRFKVLEWEKELAYAEFHPLSAQPVAEISSSPGGELSEQEASSTASDVALRLVTAEWDPSSLVQDLDGEAAAAILASRQP